MGDQTTATPGLSVLDVLALINANAALSFVGGSGQNPLTVQTLLTNYPASAATFGQYARVSDLYNNGVTGAGIDDVLRCRYDYTNQTYRWIPQRSDYNLPIASTGGTLTFVPLVTPPTMRLTGTLVSGQTITYATSSYGIASAWVGLKSRVVQNSTLGVFTTTITGLIGSNLTLLGNTVKDVEYGSTGYFASS